MQIIPIDFSNATCIKYILITWNFQFLLLVSRFLASGIGKKKQNFTCFVTLDQFVTYSVCISPAFVFLTILPCIVRLNDCLAASGGFPVRRLAPFPVRYICPFLITLSPNIPQKQKFLLPSGSTTSGPFLVFSVFFFLSLVGPEGDPRISRDFPVV